MLQGGQLAEIHRPGRRSRVNCGDRGNGGGDRTRRRTGESICYHVLQAREMEEIAGKLGQVEKP